ncbi:MAG TPA: hypothetical protein VN883_01855 [Myxococcales bacterium]|nr:hypothetical protein [Myxococcales bacterium]
MAQLLLGLAGLAGTLLSARVSERVDLLRFPLCWWSVVLVLWGAVRLRHGKAALPHLRELLLLAAGSVLFWDLFELLNLRLRDWWYVGVPEGAAAGLLFSAASFATVLPAVRLGELLLRPRGAKVSAHHEAAADPPRAARLFGTGLLLLLLALLFPEAAFPVAWVFLWPICEGALCLMPGGPGEPRGPLEAWRLGDRALALRLFAVALPIGLLWEALNWGCARGWVYTVPGFEGAKIFEMPAPGYLGYFPFLLESGAAIALLARLRAFAARESWAGHRRATMAAALALLVLLHVAVDGAARRSSCISVAPRFADAHALPQAAALIAHGLPTPRALLDELRLRGSFAVAARTGLTEAQLAEAGQLAALARVGRMGIPWAERLRSAGVSGPEDLPALGEAGLRRRLAASAATDLRAPPRPSGGPFLGGGDGGGAPAPALLRIWIASAARISR